MKRIRVTITEEYLLPDDWEILTHPSDQVRCLRHDDQYYMPVLEWAARGFVTLRGKLNRAPLVCWTSVGDEQGNWFIDQLQDTATVEIKELE
jgi:hypothetical protein